MNTSLILREINQNNAREDEAPNKHTRKCKIVDFTN